MARSFFSTTAFAQLVLRLRHTNARYNQIAHQFRCRIRSTHHAKRRAYRVGLRIDTSKARACLKKHVFTQPLVLDRSAVSQNCVDPPPGSYVTAATGVESVGHGASQGDTYMHGLPLRNLPEIVQKQRRCDGRKRIMLRLPPLKLQLDVDCSAPFRGPVPGAPRLLPRQLPDDESGMEEMMLESASSSSVNEPDSSKPSGARVYSGLCITIPPRSLKRKLQDVETDGTIVPSQQPKRVLKARWNESQTH